jgi:hypothetical protein
MSETGYFLNHCQFCGGGVEFPINGVGEQIECPHCHQSITLVFPKQANYDVSLFQSYEFETGSGFVLAPSARHRCRNRPLEKNPQAPSGAASLGRRTEYTAPDGA